MKNTTYHVLMFTAPNVRKPTKGIPAWSCRKIHDCRKTGTVDVGGQFYAVPVTKLVESHESCTCEGGIYSLTCLWSWFGPNVHQAYHQKGDGMTLDRCEEVCAVDHDQLKPDEYYECVPFKRNSNEGVKGVWSRYGNKPFDFLGFVKQNQERNRTILRGSHTIYKNVKFRDNIVDMNFAKVKYDIIPESFRGLSFIWVEDECELVISKGENWVLTPDNLYFQTDMNKEFVENVLTLKAGKINDEVLTAIILDNVEELKKVCKSFSPERLCEKMTTQENEAITNRVFAVNMLVSRPGTTQAVYKCKIDGVAGNGWKWNQDRCYTTVNATDLFKVQGKEFDKIQLPSVIRRNDNYRFYLITTDERAQEWTRKDIEKNIRLNQDQDYYQVDQSTPGADWMDRIGVTDGESLKATLIRVLTIILLAWLIFVLVSYALKFSLARACQL